MSCVLSPPGPCPKPEPGSHPARPGRHPDPLLAGPSKLPTDGTTQLAIMWQRGEARPAQQAVPKTKCWAVTCDNA